MAAAIAIVAAVTHMAPTTLWNAVPKDSGFWEQARTIKEPPRRFMQRTSERFFETGSVNDKKYPRRARKTKSMTDGEAKLAAMYLKLGHWVL